MKKAFTLIELMVVISVIAILATIALFGLRNAQNSARDTKKIAVISGIRTALERYYTDLNSYPTAYADLTTGSFTSYLTFPTASTVDNGIVGCGSAPCISYAGNATAYTINFLKQAGGTLSYFNAQ